MFMKTLILGLLVSNNPVDCSSRSIGEVTVQLMAVKGLWERKRSSRWQ